MNRQQIQALIAERRADAEVLLRESRWSLLYYTAGYLVELGLKSCVLTRMAQTGWVFRKQLPARSFLTHDFEELVKLADLQDELRAKQQGSNEFARNWGTVKRWAESSRYELSPEQAARNLLAAIDDEPDGVLAWLRNYW